MVLRKRKKKRKKELSQAEHLTWHWGLIFLKLLIKLSEVRGRQHRAALSERFI